MRKGIRWEDGETREQEVLRTLHNLINAYGLSELFSKPRDIPGLTQDELLRVLRCAYDKVDAPTTEQEASE